MRALKQRTLERCKDGSHLMLPQVADGVEFRVGRGELERA